MGSEDGPAARLRQEIENWGSIHQLANELKRRGIKASRSSIHRYLNNAPPPPGRFLQDVAPVLGIRAEWLIHGQGEKTEAAESRAMATRQAVAGLDLTAYQKVFKILNSLPTELASAFVSLSFAWNQITNATAKTELGHRMDEVQAARKLMKCVEHPLKVFGFDVYPDRLLNTPAGELYVQLLAQAIAALHWAPAQAQPRTTASSESKKS